MVIVRVYDQMGPMLMMIVIPVMHVILSVAHDLGLQTFV